MASTFNRRINLYINGKEVENSIYAISDGRKPKQYAKGLYPDRSTSNGTSGHNSQFTGIDEDLRQTLKDIRATMQLIHDPRPRLTIDKFEQERGKYIYIESHNKL